MKGQKDSNAGQVKAAGDTVLKASVNDTSWKTLGLKNIYRSKIALGKAIAHLITDIKGKRLALIL